MLIVPVLAFLATGVGIWFLLRSKLAMTIAMDTPNHRSLHSEAVPRVGGLVFVPAILIAWCLVPNLDRYFSALVAVIALFSFLDDRSQLPAVLRLVVHMAVSAIYLLLASGSGNYSFPLFALATIWIGWCINSFNFMDGADGLAGGMAVFGFSTYGTAASFAGSYNLSIACFTVAAASLAFLVFNFSPARVFMGDAGSTSLGFIVGSLGLWGLSHQTWPFWFPLLTFAPFFADSTITLAKRALRNERVWEAHRDHYYQRLVRMGWTHRRLALTEYFLMAACSGSALWLINATETVQYIGLAVWLSIYALAMRAIDQCWKKHLAQRSPS